MIGLRVKLAAYFLVLAMLPLAAAYWGFSSSARAGEENRANERLQTALRAGVASIQSELESAKRDALAVAAARGCTKRWPPATIAPSERLVAGRSDVQIRGNGVLAGTAPRGAHVEVDVTDGQRTIGTVVATAAFDDDFAKRLLRSSVSSAPTGSHSWRVRPSPAPPSTPTPCCEHDPVNRSSPRSTLRATGP